MVDYDGARSSFPKFSSVPHPLAFSLWFISTFAVDTTSSLTLFEVGASCSPGQVLCSEVVGRSLAHVKDWEQIGISGNISVGTVESDFIVVKIADDTAEMRGVLALINDSGCT
jgi:hypothetical protein